MAMVVYGITAIPATAPGPAAVASPPPRTQAAAAADVATLDASPPVRIVIERLGIDASVLRLGLNTDGTVAVPRPEQARQAGWYDASAAPGQRGPAVVLGHVDSARLPGGKAVFYRLGQARPGDRVKITRTDGITARFTVDSVTQVPRERFPTEAVYGPTHTAQLRLITCGGTYTEAGGYDSNVIVFAHYTGARG
ncbi:class F sortase [Streptomyces sp. VB1]|uniref:class F sortase n=1 Tax=Streptomyces sp. VB1 TaxID=2986803 RepID=UPI002242B6FC|nr:class F sortase [Streptomyces sp. VB1]UZI28203.1 class F sortase [Streptomyces sp. VB1]